jgi:hypothetical protein
MSINQMQKLGSEIPRQALKNSPLDMNLDGNAFIKRNRKTEREIGSKLFGLGISRDQEDYNELARTIEK